MTRAPMRAGHLREEQAHAAGSGVHQRGVAGLERIGGVGEIMRRHALQHGRRRLLHAQALRNLDQLRGGNQSVLRVAADDGGGSDRVAGCESRNAGAELLHRARGFAAGIRGQRGLVDAFAEVDLDEVDAVASMRIRTWPGPGSGMGSSVSCKNFGSASRMKLNGFHVRDKDEPWGRGKARE